MIRIIKDFYSPLDCLERTIRVYTPESYEGSTKSYPVLYAFDGQNIFSHPESAQYDTWCVNWSLERLYRDKLINREWIVVGVDHLNDRLSEYSPWPFEGVRLSHGDGLKTLRTFTDVIKPYIDSAYRTLKTPKDTAIMGSSLGGLMSLYFGHKRGDIYGIVGAFSPTISWSDYQILELYRRKPSHSLKMYLDVGSEEKFMSHGVFLDYPEALSVFYKQLKSIGFSDQNMTMIVEENAYHYETDWARRFPYFAQRYLR